MHGGFRDCFVGEPPTISVGEKEKAAVVAGCVVGECISQHPG